MNNKHNIDNFMKLATNHNSDSDLTDQYYRAKYEEIASGKKITLNWSAFFCGVYWLLYRKMYLYGILWGIFQLAYSICISYFLNILANTISSGALKIFLKITIGILSFAPSILLGFIGNWLYVQQIHKKIDKGYHLNNAKNIDKLTWIFALVLSLFFTT